MRCNERTVRFLRPDGEDVAVNVQAAHAFLKILLRCTDRPTGLLCLETEAPFRALSLGERRALIAEDHFEQHVLEREERTRLRIHLGNLRRRASMTDATKYGTSAAQTSLGAPQTSAKRNGRRLRSARRVSR